MNRFIASRHVGACLLLCFALTSGASATEPPITAVAFTPGGKSVVAVSQSGLYVFGWPKLDRQRTIKTSASNLHSVTFSPKGKHLAVGGGNAAQFALEPRLPLFLEIGFYGSLRGTAAGVRAAISRPFGSG